MNYTIYSSATGQILRIVQTTDIQSQLQPGEQYLDGSLNDSVYYVDSGNPVEFPPRPGSQYVFDFSSKQWVDPRSPEQKYQQADSAARSQRKILLEKSDWTQLADIPAETKALWEPYRQELRDITDQPGYPFNVIWPTPPAA
jgi:hypothetical protein